MTPEQLRDVIAPVTQQIQGKALGKALEAELNQTCPVDGGVFQSVFTACRDAIKADWMGDREAGGIKFGRVVKPGPELHGFSVDVVEMDNIKGPHHRHPNGEIDMITPLTADARFDEHGAGWLVYGPNSAHSPTVSTGKVLVLYLPPQAAIEFTPVH